MKLGIIGTSTKADERRVPIHTDHLTRLPESIRRELIFERGYGERFGLSDSELAAQTGGIATRHELLTEVGAVVLPKSEPVDLKELKEGGVLWGWAHCTQQAPITQMAIDRKQTLIAFEDMHVWGPHHEQGRHTFYKNNEMAGYCAVLHAMQLRGIDGHYGKRRKAIIFSFGAVSRGAIYALKALGIRDILICIQRPDHMVREEILACTYSRIREGEEGEARMMVVDHDGIAQPLTELIEQADLIINGTFQDPENPIYFVTEDEAKCLKPGALIIDVSCDEGMGFYFAKPTTFKEPMFRVGKVDYYAVDHTPSYLWESASRSISGALLVHLPSVMEGPEGWKKNETIRQAINLDQGVIQKPYILSFQNRAVEYPHSYLTANV